MAYGRSWLLARLTASSLAFALAACGGAGGDGIAGVGTARDLATVGFTGVTAARSSAAGAFAADYLRGAHFSTLVVEVGHPAGRRPSQAVLDLLRERLSERCEKPGGVVIEFGEEIPAEEFPDPISDGDLEDLEDAHRRRYSDRETKVAAIYALFVPGASVDDEGSRRKVGTSYRGGSLAVFIDAVDQGANPYVTTEEMTGQALIHEMGHLIGLVNRGVPMVEDHEDPNHRGHDSDPTSVMYWHVKVSRVRPNLGDPDFAQFGAACLADLRAFGGR